MGEIKEDLKENAMLLHEKSKYGKNKLFQVNFDVKIPIQNCDAPYERSPKSTFAPWEECLSPTSLPLGLAHLLLTGINSELRKGRQRQQ